ncbi:hypothetical protein FE257_001779 [Aspergillus nanangensis]|uniref:Uncharacterized protein n=1 Tax=Aspergillus nanangensis TaxID=2582783 RepID=A0AAD4CEP9_ASPNN|nr:hypothetical protein FE257_001779 [Aspergillus nanangensis]
MDDKSCLGNETNMPFASKDTTSRFSQASSGQQQQNPSTTSSKKSQFPGDWNIEQELETTVDKNGNPVPDAAFTDGKMMSSGQKGPGEADPYLASTMDAEDFE